jgi:flagellar motor switch protein FliM
MSNASYKEQPQENEDVVWQEGGIGDLLGFDLEKTPTSDRSGLKALINSALVAHPRLPMLDVVFDRTARRMATSLRQLTDESVEVALENVTSTRFGDFAEQIGDSAIIGVFGGQGLDGYALVATDARFAFAVVDFLLGGRRSPSLTDYSARRLTAIELSLSQRLLSLLADDFAVAFSLIAPAQFTLERVETTPRFAAVAQDQSVCAMARYRVKIEDFSASIVFLTPYASIETVRARLKRDFIDDSARADEIWSTALGAELAGVGVEMRAVIAECDISLGELRALKPGATLSLRAGTRHPVDLRAGGARIASGRAGRSGDSLAIRIEHCPVKAEAAKP